MDHLPALFIGRFQPFHLGHLDAVRQILERESFVIIAIGSSQESGTPENPWSCDERKLMIQEALKEANISESLYTIVVVPDIHDAGRWVAHVESLAPPFGNLYTGSDTVKRLFVINGNHKVITLKKRVEVSGTQVREMLDDTKKQTARDTELPLPAAVKKTLLRET